MNDERAAPCARGPAEPARLCTQSDVAAQYAQHHARLRQVAGDVFGGRRPETADDAIMLVFTRLLDLVEEGRLTDKGEMWGPYLRQAVRNRCIDILRGEVRERHRFPAADTDKPQVVDLDPLGDAVADSDETRRRLARLPRAVASLSDRHAAIVKHKFWDLWSDRKIGETLGITGQAVGQQLRTALKRLHEEVTKDDRSTPT